jgi:hypothetical protein
MVTSAIVVGSKSSQPNLKRLLEEADFSEGVVEEDRLFAELNGGAYPLDEAQRERELRPMLNDVVNDLDGALYLTSYPDLNLLAQIKGRGGKVIEVRAPREMLAGAVAEFEMLRQSGLVDHSVDASRGTEAVAAEVRGFLEKARRGGR